MARKKKTETPAEAVNENEVVQEPSEEESSQEEAATLSKEEEAELKHEDAARKAREAEKAAAIASLKRQSGKEAEEQKPEKLRGIKDEDMRFIALEDFGATIGGQHLQFKAGEVITDQFHIHEIVKQSGPIEQVSTALKVCPKCQHVFKDKDAQSE